MSLIEEALRKQREETEKVRGGNTVQTPPAPPPPPLPEIEEQVEESVPVRKALPVMIAVVVGGIILVAVIVWVLLYGFNFRVGAEKPAVERAVVTGQASTTTVVAAVATSGPAVVVPAPVVAPVAVQPEAVPVVVTSAPVAAVEVPVLGSATAATVAVAEPVAAVQKMAVVVWPKLTVTGLIGSAKERVKSAAIINGQMVMPGAVVEGVKIESIDKQGVKLSYEGEFRTLSVGGTTE